VEVESRVNPQYKLRAVSDDDGIVRIDLMLVGENENELYQGYRYLSLDSAERFANGLLELVEWCKSNQEES
jgi:hypothetical protein